MTNRAVVPLAPRDLLVLAVLSDGPLHGYGIVKAVESRSAQGVLLDPANLYRMLRRMSRDGWVEEVESPAEGRRRTFDLTGTGREVLGAEIRRLDRLLSQVRPVPAQAEGP